MDHGAMNETLYRAANYLDIMPWLDRRPLNSPEANAALTDRRIAVTLEKPPGWTPPPPQTSPSAKNHDGEGYGWHAQRSCAKCEATPIGPKISGPPSLTVSYDPDYLCGAHVGNTFANCLKPRGHDGECGWK